MMRNEDFSDGYFTGLLWGERDPQAVEKLEAAGNGSAYADAVNAHIAESVLGDSADKRLWGEGFIYGAKAAMRRAAQGLMTS